MQYQAVDSAECNAVEVYPRNGWTKCYQLDIDSSISQH